MTSALARAVAAGLAAALLVPAVVFADADPASDVLLGTSVFYPYTPPVSIGLQEALNAEAAAASRAHFPIKTAIIASPVDLGAVPDLFGMPQKYADFLEQEISFTGPQPLLVVMPGGFGVAGLRGPARSAAATLARPAGQQSDALTEAAIAAVAKLAAAAGHPIAVPAIPKGGSSRGSTGGSGGGSSVLIVAILALVAIAAAAAVIAIRRRSAAR